MKEVSAQYAIFTRIASSIFFGITSKTTSSQSGQNIFKHCAQTSFTNFYGSNSYPFYCYWNYYFYFLIHVGRVWIGLGYNLKAFYKVFLRAIPVFDFYHCGEGKIVRKNKKYSENHQNAYQSEGYIITI